MGFMIHFLCHWAHARNQDQMRFCYDIPSLRLSSCTHSLAFSSLRASLLIAVIFHQLFEGLSLGVRIASLPSFSPSPLPSPVVSTLHTGSRPSDVLPNIECEVHDRSMSPALFNVDVELGFTAHNERGKGFHRHIKAHLGTSVCSNDARRYWAGNDRVWGTRCDVAYVRLIQGLMPAISAGMLIYAACVEVLAADFITDRTL
ncbi:hypothetical protein EDC04DRAFT_2650868 [Pisolithus marmoratus]|nr:hypothetical protein EDC04DRAFT_2650868 [Pisolithus marmoratus]